jgi:8-oxo-dGTP pyrophosphatase MutT (NUDIX family)
MSDPSAARLPVVALERVEMSFAPRPWPFAIERRAEIDACFAQLQREKPALWNGRVLMMHHHTLIAGKLCGAFLETDFASLLAWRAFDFPDPTIKVCFPMSALHSTDGAFLLGLMAPHTANAGQLYFPTGTPDPDDVRGDKVDFDDSLLRELVEETGLGPADVTAVPGWHAVLAGPRIALIKLLQVAAPAALLRARILAHLAREPEPELCDIVIVRDPADLDPRMPAFVTAFLTDFWSKRAP